MKKITKLSTNFYKSENNKRKEILKTLGNKLALSYLESLRGQELDSRQVSTNLNTTK